MSSRAEFERLKGRCLGREKGLVPELFAEAEVPAAGRARGIRRAGQRGQDGDRGGDRRASAAAVEAAEAVSRDRAAAVDVTLPGRRPRAGGLHPITIVRRQIEDIFLRMGYSIADGPEVENDFHNFEALNFPPDHPARDSQDTLLVDRKARLAAAAAHAHLAGPDPRDAPARRAAAPDRAGARLPQGRGRRDALAGLPPGRGPRRGPGHLDGRPEGHGRRVPRGALRQATRGRASSRRSSPSSSPGWTSR